MANTHSSIATDSEAALRGIAGPDATAGFEEDPKFIDSNPTSTASSSNILEQRDTDDTADSLEEEDEEAELDEDEDLDEEDDEDEDDEEEEDEDEDEDEDDEAEVAALHARTFEDDADADVEDGDVNSDVDEDADGDDLDADRVGDAALGLSGLGVFAGLRIAPATSVRAASQN